MPVERDQKPFSALDLLSADHKEVQRLFKAAENAGRAAKRELFVSIKTELEAHAWIEETTFYPTLQGTGDETLIQLCSEAIQEHIGMKCALGELGAAILDPSRFEPLLTNLIEDVRHHVEEEEGEMFTVIRKKFSDEELNVIGSAMLAEKKRFQASAETIFV